MDRRRIRKKTLGITRQNAKPEKLLKKIHYFQFRAKSLYNMKKLQSFYDLPVSLFIIPQLLFVETYKLGHID